MRDQKTSELAHGVDAHSLQRLVRPRVGDTWEVRRPNRQKITKTIGRISRIWLGKYPYQRRLPYAHWQRLPKGRYSGIRIKWLLKYGRRIKTKAQQDAEDQARWARLGKVA